MDSTSNNGSPLKVLVVEDDEMVRDYAQAVLSALGYEPLAVSDAAAALQVLDQESDIRLMITDIGLPGAMNGTMLAAEARRRRPHLPVLFASGSVDSAGRSDRLPEGEAVIAKPYRKSELAEKLRLLLGA
jgi:CheY-like chemotaxis protein